MRAPKAVAFVLGAILSASPAVSCPAAGAEQPSRQIAGPATLSNGITVVPVELARGPEAGREPTLLVEGLRFTRAPGVSYEVLLQNRQGRRAPLGMISFFNQTAPDADPAAGKTYRFETADALHALGGSAVALVFVPSAGVSDVVARPQEGAQVRFQAVRLQQD